MVFWSLSYIQSGQPDRKAIRLCGDFKQTVIRVSKLNRFPIEDLLPTLKGGQYFSSWICNTHINS